VFLRLLLRAIAIWVFLAGVSVGQALLEPPYGLKWGDSPEKLIVWASRHSLDVNILLPGDQPALRVVKISSRTGTLPDATESAIEGRFISGRLYEITVHYDGKAATADTVESRFQALKQQLTMTYGALTANQQARSTEDRFTTRTVSFHRETVKGLFLLMAFTEVEDLARKSREARYSVIYRNDNLRTEVERTNKVAPAPPEGP
jgi:hypothetical protein